MNLHFFLTKLDAGGFPNIYPNKPVVVELSNGLILGGGLERCPLQYVPSWITPPHEHIGQYIVYMRLISFSWTSNLMEKNTNSHSGNALPLHIYVHMPTGMLLSATHFQFVDTHHQYNFTGTDVYISMPDGSVYYSRFR